MPTVETMPTPGATRSGFWRTVPAAGPSAVGVLPDHRAAAREARDRRRPSRWRPRRRPRGSRPGCRRCRRRGRCCRRRRPGRCPAPASGGSWGGTRCRWPSTADQELLTTLGLVGRGRVAVGVGHPLRRRRAGRCRCPTPLAPIARATTSRAPGRHADGRRRRRCRRPWSPRCACRGRCRPSGVGLVADEVVPGDDLAGEVAAGGVDAGVDGADRDALAAHAVGGPGGRRVDRVEAPVARAGVGERDRGGLDRGVGDARRAGRGRRPRRRGRRRRRGSRRGCPVKATALTSQKSGPGRRRPRPPRRRRRRPCAAGPGSGRPGGPRSGRRRPARARWR